jgi:hypothetical protein
VRAITGQEAHCVLTLTWTPLTRTKLKRIDDHQLRQAVELHVRASKKLSQLREEHQALLNAGETREAKAALSRAERIQTVVRALEAQVARGSGT